MLDLRRIGLFTRDLDQDYRLDKLERLFRRANIELVSDAATVADGELDLVIALGGDGTVLRALAAHPSAPVLAVNFGSVGFLTQSDREDMDKVLVRLLSDDYAIEERLTLSVGHREARYRCVNEMVLKGMSRMVSVRIEVNGRTVHTARGDGVIVGTPTGSTAYLLSVGAPLVTPDVDCIILKPLNEYSFSSRTIILPGSAELKLYIEGGEEGDIFLVADGGDLVEAAVGDTLEITRSPTPAKLVYLEPDYFFRNLRDRLRW